MKDLSFRYHILFLLCTWLICACSGSSYLTESDDDLYYSKKDRKTELQPVEGLVTDKMLSEYEIPKENEEPQEVYYREDVNGNLIPYYPKQVYKPNEDYLIDENGDLVETSNNNGGNWHANVGLNSTYNSYSGFNTYPSLGIGYTSGMFSFGLGINQFNPYYGGMAYNPFCGYCQPNYFGYPGYGWGNNYYGNPYYGGGYYYPYAPSNQEYRKITSTQRPSVAGNNFNSSSRNVGKKYDYQYKKSSSNSVNRYTYSPAAKARQNARSYQSSSSSRQSSVTTRSRTSSYNSNPTRQRVPSYQQNTPNQTRTYTPRSNGGNSRSQTTSPRSSSTNNRSTIRR